MASRLRASPDQFSLMLEFMETHGDLFRTHPGVEERLTTEGMWSELTQQLNSVGGRGVVKSLEKWKRTWSDWKTKTKRKACASQPLTSIEKRVLNFIDIGTITVHQPIQQEIEEAEIQVVAMPTEPTTISLPSLFSGSSYFQILINQPSTSQASSSVPIGDDDQSEDLAEAGPSTQPPTNVAEDVAIEEVSEDGHSQEWLHQDLLD